MQLVQPTAGQCFLAEGVDHDFHWVQELLAHEHDHAMSEQEKQEQREEQEEQEYERAYELEREREQAWGRGWAPPAPGQDYGPAPPGADDGYAAAAAAAADGGGPSNAGMGMHHPEAVYLHFMVGLYKYKSNSIDP
jgi:TolA-binding protein